MKTTNLILFTTFVLATAIGTMATAQTTSATVETRIPAVITGGHATDPRDHGRPVVLVASALGVAPEVFRDAFSRVKPAPAGERPDPAQVQLNKQTLLASLGPYGVTNDRLDEVSNFYRYNGRAGGVWRHTSATVTATVRNGVVTGFTIVNAGAGYTSAPDISVPGQPDLKVKVTLTYGPDFASNGSLKEIQLADGQP